MTAATTAQILAVLNSSYCSPPSRQVVQTTQIPITVEETTDTVTTNIASYVTQPLNQYLTRHILLFIEVLVRVTQSLDIKYHIVGRTTQSLILKYNIIERVVQSLILKYNILQRAAQSLIIKYHNFWGTPKPKTLLQNTRGNFGATGITTAGATQYWKIAVCSLVANTTEAVQEITWRTAGTFSMLYVKVIANTTSADSTVTLRKNRAATAMTFTIPAGATGEFQNMLNPVTIVAGDEVDCQTVSGGTGTFTMAILSALFESSSGNCVTKFSGYGHSHNTASTTQYLPISGSRSGGTANEANVEQIIGVAGTIKNGYFYTQSNARTTNTILTLRKNGADTAISFTITSGQTGVFEDTSNSVSVAAGDKINWSITTGTGTEIISLTNYAFEFETTSFNGFITASSVGSSADITISPSVTNYFTLGGGYIEETVEDNAKGKLRQSYKLSNLTVYAGANTITANSTVKLRINGADGNQNLTIGSSTTGYFTDTTNTDIVKPEDDVDIAVTTGGTGTTLTLRQIGIWTRLDLTAIQRSTILKYNIVGRVLQSLILKYNILQRTVNSTILKYNIVGRATNSVILRYNIIGRVVRSTILKYHIQERVSRSLILKYNILARVSQALVIKYNILGRVVQNTILKYNIIGRTTRVLIVKYNIVGRITQPLIIKYNIIGRVVRSIILKYNIIGRVTRATILKYHITGRVTQSVIIKYHIFAAGLTRVTQSLILKYNIQARTTRSLILKYNILERVTRSTVLKYHIFNRVTQSIILKYNILNRVTRSIVLKYNILQRVTQQLTLLYNIVGKVEVKAISFPRVIKYPVTKAEKVGEDERQHEFIHHLIERTRNRWLRGVHR